VFCNHQGFWMAELEMSVVFLCESSPKGGRQQSSRKPTQPFYHMHKFYPTTSTGFWQGTALNSTSPTTQDMQHSQASQGRPWSESCIWWPLCSVLQPLEGFGWQSWRCVWYFLVGLLRRETNGNEAETQHSLFTICTNFVRAYRQDSGRVQH
jgi:hypothetical protein